MTSQRVFAIILLALGSALLYMGMSASHSLADQFSHAVTGRFTDSTTWYLLGGLGSVTLGLLLFAFGARRRRRRA